MGWSITGKDDAGRDRFARANDDGSWDSDLITESWLIQMITSKEVVYATATDVGRIVDGYDLTAIYLATLQIWRKQMSPETFDEIKIADSPFQDVETDPDVVY